MLEANLYNIEGQEVGKVALPSAVFGLEVNKHLLHEAVTRYLANRRKGSASTKTRAEVSGGGHKPWKQKGTGRARAGSTRSPLWRHGGITFGPHPRSYFINWPKQKVRLALYQALSSKAQDQGIKVLERIEVAEAKTRQLVLLLDKIKILEKSLIVVAQREQKLFRAARNLNWVSFCTPEQLNVFNVLDSSELIFTPQSLEFLERKNV